MKNQLIKLGFSEKEALVYMTLLRIGPAVASTLARLTGIKRTSIYDTTNRLLEDNLIMSFKQGAYTYFVVDDVKKLYLYEKQKAEFAMQLVEELQKEKNVGPGIQVSYYKGEEGYNELYNDILRIAPEEIVGWMNLDEFYKKIDPIHEEKWTKERIKKKIKVRLLLKRTKLTEDFQKYDAVSNRETRFLPKNHTFQTSCLLHKNNIIFFSPDEETVGIRIQHPELYTMQKEIFEMNWNSCETSEA